MAVVASPRTGSPSQQTSPREAETPTSSVRPSVDIPKTDTAEAVANQRRHRAALRDYYKLKSQQLPSSATASDDGSNGAAARSGGGGDTPSPSSGTAATTTTASLLAKLDDSSFEANSFVSSLLATGSLQDILRTEAVLVSEIRNLDGECKALVYDNYSKLIKAVGTIGNMQKGMQKNKTGENKIKPPMQIQIHHPSRRGGGDDGDGGKLDDVDELKEKLQDLETVAAQLNPPPPTATAGEAERRKKRSQKDLVRWVLAAPARLENLCKDEDKRQDAELEWARVKQLLDQWENVKGVEDVRLACAAAMKENNNSPENG